MSRKFLVLKRDHNKFVSYYGPFESKSLALDWINKQMSVFLGFSKFSIEEIFQP